MTVKRCQSVFTQCKARDPTAKTDITRQHSEQHTVDLSWYTNHAKQ